MSPPTDPVWWDGDPYLMDNEGEYVEVHHGGRD
jgi:hypothetical protein